MEKTLTNSNKPRAYTVMDGEILYLDQRSKVIPEKDFVLEQGFGGQKAKI